MQIINKTGYRCPDIWSSRMACEENHLYNSHINWYPFFKILKKPRLNPRLQKITTKDKPGIMGGRDENQMDTCRFRGISDGFVF